jgi:hypothetical protein
MPHRMCLKTMQFPLLLFCRGESPNSDFSRIFFFWGSRIGSFIPPAKALFPNVVPCSGPRWHLLEKSPFPSVLWDLTLFQYGGLAQWSGWHSWSRMTSSHDPNSTCKDPISKWGPILKSQVTQLLGKSPLPSVLWDLTIFQYGGLAQWRGSSQDPSFLDSLRGFLKVKFS